MKKIWFFLCVLFFSTGGFSEVLSPTDPQFSWMDALIEKDFANVKKRISSKDYLSSIATHNSNSWIVRFRVIDNHVEGPNGPCFNMLEHLCEIYGLPNLDFLYWNQDGPWGSLGGTVPVLTGARTVGARNTILFSDWIFDIQNPSSGWNSEIQIINDNPPMMRWSEKENKLFWRGMGTDVWSAGLYSVANWENHARGKPCALSLKYPELIDAAFTGFHHFLCDGGESEMKKLEQVVPMSQRVPLIDHFKYKYQLQISGLMGSFPRDRWQFYSESVVFRCPHPHEMYWYNLLIPWKHFIPIETSMDDLVNKIEWARLHDEECHEIAIRGRVFAQTHFMPEHMALYCYKVLLKYAQIQGYDPKKIK